jgi:hypothetical protein
LRRAARTFGRCARNASREHELHFPSKKNPFLFSRGKISASSRRVERARRSPRHAVPGGDTRKIFLQNS